MIDQNKPLIKVELRDFRVVVNLFSAESRVKLLKEMSIARLEFY